MAFNPLDYLKDLVPQNTNMFGASPNANLKQMSEMGLLGDMDYTDMLKKANKQSIFQGLLNTGLSYAAQPKNQGYGSIFPYLAKAGLAGVQAAQSPYDQLTQNAMTSAKLQEMKRAKDKEALKDKFLSTWGQDNTGNMRVNGDQMVNVASQGYATGQDYGVGSSLMGARNAPNPMNIVSPNFNTNQSSIQSLLDNQLLGTDPESFLLDNNNLEQQMVGSFDSMKAIDDAVANGALELKDALAMKASIATSKADTVQFRNQGQDILVNGVVTERGVSTSRKITPDELKDNIYGDLPMTDSAGNKNVWYLKDGVPLNVNKISSPLVTVDNSQSKGNEAFGKGLSTDIQTTLTTGYSGAKSALNSIGVLDKLVEITDTGIYAGKGAAMKESLVDYGLQFGFINPESAEATKSLGTKRVIQIISQQQLDEAKANKGQGTLSDAERAIMAKARLGTLDVNNAQQIAMLAHVLKKLNAHKIVAHYNNLEKTKKAFPGELQRLDFYNDVGDYTPDNIIELKNSLKQKGSIEEVDGVKTFVIDGKVQSIIDAEGTQPISGGRFIGFS